MSTSYNSASVTRHHVNLGWLFGIFGIFSLLSVLFSQFYFEQIKN